MQRLQEICPEIAYFIGEFRLSSRYSSKNIIYIISGPVRYSKTITTGTQKCKVAALASTKSHYSDSSSLEVAEFTVFLGTLGTVFGLLKQQFVNKRRE